MIYMQSVRRFMANTQNHDVLLLLKKKKVKIHTQTEKNYFAALKKPCREGKGTARKTLLAVTRFSQLLNCLVFSMKKDKV